MPKHGPYRIKLNRFERGKGLTGPEYVVFLKKNDVMMIQSDGDKKI